MIKVIIAQRCKMGHMANTKSPTWPMCGEYDCDIMAESSGEVAWAWKSYPLTKRQI